MSDMPNYQTLFNLSVGVIGIVGGWMLNAIWGAVKELQSVDKELAEKVSQIEVLVAGKYVTREEFSMSLNTINMKLDRIQQSLSEKADR